MIGEIRVITDARVLEHNATGVLAAEGGGTEYVWVIRDMDGPATGVSFEEGRDRSRADAGIL